MGADSDIIRHDAREVSQETEPLEGEVLHETTPLDDVHAATTVLSREKIPAVADVTAEAQVQTGSLLRERFLLQEEVDAGGMGVVYRALDQQMSDSYGDPTSVAIKVLSPKLARNSKALRALQQEATKIRCLTHPHIVRFIDFDRDGDQYFLVMEWLEGRTLASILDSADARNIDRIYAMRIVRQIGGALEYAHRCGIVHADVKPGNVMILPNGDAKLFDFGVARVRQAQSAARVDRDAISAATPAYASMQVLTGEVPAATDDVFSLACLLYRLIAGYRVFGPRNAADASQEGMSPQRPQGFSDKQWSAMRKALSYSRVTRFAAMGEFISALDEEVDLVPDSPSPQTMDLEVPGYRSKLPIVAAMFLLVVTVSVAMSDRGRSWLQSIVAATEPEPAVATLEGGGQAAVPETMSPITEPVIESKAEIEPAREGVPENIQAEAPEARVAVVDEAPVQDEVSFGNDGLSEEEGSSETELPSEAEVPAAAVSVVAPVPKDTVGFSSDEVRVRESESAVQIDITRTGSIQLPLTIEYTITGITAAEGVDFFAPDSSVISFAAGQDTVRLLIPLVQDFAVEGDEHFMLRLRETAGITAVAGRHSTVVTIRDDEPQIP